MRDIAVLVSTAISACAASALATQPARQVSTPVRKLVSAQSQQPFEREIYGLGAKGGSSRLHFLDVQVAGRQQEGSTANRNVFSLHARNGKPPTPNVRFALVNPEGKSFSSRVDGKPGLMPIAIDGEYVAAGNTVLVLNLETPDKGFYRVYKVTSIKEDEGERTDKGGPEEKTQEDPLFYLSIDDDAARAEKRLTTADKKAAIDRMVERLIGGF